MCIKFSLLIVVLVWESSAVQYANVKLPAGEVRGLLEDEWASWRGIPFAESIVGENRWTLPQPRAPWSGVVDATEYKPACAQNCVNPPVMCPKTFTEDCLTLNVWSPRDAMWGWNVTTNLLPVMVWIHGGDYKESWAGPRYAGSHWANLTNHVFVAMNYRLGALGFMYYEEGGITPNLGIWDQRVALQWVQDNIRYFGGDASRVTIFGQSAGAGSVLIHYTSDASRGLFSAAIMMSNPAAISYKDPKGAAKDGKSLAKALNCHPLFHHKPTDVINCMKNKTDQEIVAAQVKVNHDRMHLPFPHTLEFAYIFSPLIGTPDIPIQPIQAIEQGKYNTSLPFISGWLKDDGWEFVNILIKKATPGITCDALVTAIFGPTAAIEITKQYPCKQYKDARETLDHMMTDYVFACSNHHMASIASRVYNTPTYLYNYTHQLSFDPYLPKFPDCGHYVCHASELPVLFLTPKALDGTLTSGEEVLGKQMMYMFASVLKKGAHDEPITGNGNGVVWPPVGKGVTSSPTLQIGPAPTQYKVYNTHTPEVCRLWDSIGYVNK